MKIVIGGASASSCYRAALTRDTSDPALNDCGDALLTDQSRRDRAATYVNRAILFEARGDTDAALADLEDARDLAPNVPEVHMTFGSVYLDKQQWRSAEDAFTRALDLEIAAAPRAHYARAIAREELGDIPGAYEDYSTAADLAPDWDAPRLELQRFHVADGSGGGGGA